MLQERERERERERLQCNIWHYFSQTLFGTLYLTALHTGGNSWYLVRSHAQGPLISSRVVSFPYRFCTLDLRLLVARSRALRSLGCSCRHIAHFIFGAALGHRESLLNLGSVLLPLCDVADRSLAGILVVAVLG